MSTRGVASWTALQQVRVVTHVPLQEDHVTIKLSLLQCGQQQYTIQQCSFTETELQQMTTLHEGYFSSFTGPLYHSKEHCNWNTTYCNVSGVSFGCLYADISQQEALQGECLKTTDDDEVKIETVEYAGSHDPSSHDNEFFMPLLCYMLYNICHCQSGDHVSIKYQSLMCNKGWFSDMTTQLHYESCFDTLMTSMQTRILVNH